MQDTARPDWGRIFGPSRRLGWESRVWFGAGPSTVATFTDGGKPIYLATPYTNRVTGADGRWSYEASLHASAQAARELGRLARVQVTGISPIVQSAEMVHAEAFERQIDGLALDPLSRAFWLRWCVPLLNVCGAIVVPDIEGWRESAGVYSEVMWALRETNVPVFFYAGDI